MVTRTMSRDGSTYDITIGPAEPCGKETDLWGSSNYSLERAAFDAARTVKVELIRPMRPVVDGKVERFKAEQRCATLAVFDGHIQLIQIPDLRCADSFASLVIAREAAAELIAGTVVGACL